MSDHAKSFTELLGEHEDVELEAKAAQGRNGRGEVPHSIWESYSAMANTEGGIILLGVEEDATGRLNVLGLQDFDRVRKTAWDNLNNRQIVSTNLLREQDMVEVDHEGLRVLVMRVPRATRFQRPVYVGSNPLTGSYRRNFEGDYRCDEETVRRMLAEAVETARDALLLSGFGMSDLDMDSLSAYRNQMRATSPNHPWLALDDQGFLRSLGGWMEDRKTKETGLTLAGLLMFGRLPSIHEAVPHYVVDYQERPMVSSDQRWLDRVTTDGTWSGNLFDFYRRVFPRLTSDLKVPFRLQQNSKRVDENHVHEALREALVNTLIHADFTDRISILIVKRGDFFGFRNPGGLRLPVEVVLKGGESDCRNRRLQKMFQLIGAAEQAGSGFPKILRAWKEQHWRFPLLDEKYQPEQTVLRLPTTSLLPPEAIVALDTRFGQKFRELDEVERLAVVTAFVEEKVTNQRLRTMTDSHARDLTTIFKSLVNNGFLVPDGVGRGTCYRLPGQKTSEFEEALPGMTDTLFGRDEPPKVPVQNSEHLSPDSEHLAMNSEHLAPDSEHYKRLIDIAAPVKQTSNAPAEKVQSTILQLCQDTFLSLRTLADLLNRSPDTLRVHYLSSMIKSGLLEYRYPDKANHPQQGYRTVKTL